MRFAIACSVALLVCGVAARARAEDSQPTPAAAQVQELLESYKKTVADFQKAYEEAKTEADKQNVVETLGASASPDAFAPKFLAVIRQYPGDPGALEALSWMFQRTGHQPDTLEAVKILIPHWAADAHLERICRMLTYIPCPAGDKLLEAALEKNPSRSVQGLACYGLAASLRDQAERIGNLDLAKSQKLEAEAEKLFDRAASQYGDVKRGGTLQEETEKELYALRNLAIGKTAPEIAGEDVLGKPLKLSDYRGKVVLVVFWASWCGPCMADVPHERELIDRFHGQPFAIVGVNGDGDRQAAREAMTKTSMTWRSFWSSEGSRGPIPNLWNVHSWPTLYLLDAHGVIRYKGNYLRRHLFEKDQDGQPRSVYVLDQAVDKLMREVNGQKSSH